MGGGFSLSGSVIEPSFSLAGPIVGRNFDLATGVGGGNALGASGWVLVLVLLVSILLVAFFSSSEASLISVNKIRLQHKVRSGNRSAQSVMRVVSNHEKFFATILLTENACIILASSVGTALSIQILGEGGASVLIATLVMTGLIVTFGEITPKSLAALASDRWSLIVARPIEIIMTLETWIVWVFTLLPKFIVRLLGGREHLTSPSITEGELRMLIDIAQSEGEVQPREAELLEGVFELGDQQVREVQTPRTEVIWVEQGTTLDDFLSLYARYPYSRFPVYESSVDNVVGTLTVKDVLKAIAGDTINSASIVTALSRPPFFVPETKSIAELLREFQSSGTNLAITVDEFGGTDGLVTLTQLFEVMVGPLSTLEGMPADIEEIQQIEPNKFEADGGVSVEIVNRQANLKLPEGDYETLAGYLLTKLGHIPSEGEIWSEDGTHLTVLKVRGVRIERVRIEQQPGNLDMSEAP